MPPASAVTASTWSKTSLVAVQVSGPGQDRRVDEHDVDEGQEGRQPADDLGP